MNLDSEAISRLVDRLRRADEVERRALRRAVHTQALLVQQAFEDARGRRP